MKVLDPGHIYRIAGFCRTHAQYLKFVKRSGGAITYAREWPGIQTQAVMRALIDFTECMELDEEGESKTYDLWQLGCDDPWRFTLHGISDAQDTLHVLVDRSLYLNAIIECVETRDACVWLSLASSVLGDPDYHPVDRFREAGYHIRMALWNYEARAWRRKQESVNRKLPTHDDSARLRSWRHQQAEDVPFNEVNIERRPIGSDGHILLS